MPIAKGISVTVHTASGPLTEYGSRRLGSGSTTSTFIESEDNTPFWISLSPPSTFDYKTTLDSKPLWYSPNTRRRIFGRPLGFWDLSAQIYIDGNRRVDKNVIIDLPREGNPYDPYVAAYGRSCRDKEGKPSEQAWVFKEVGIENYFKTLTTDDKVAGEESEWEIDSADEPESEEDAVSMGQIVVKLFRVRQYGLEPYGVPEKHFSQSSVDRSKGSPNLEISHTVGAGEMKRKDFHYVAVDYLDSPNDPWATIIFMYRGKKQLQKMGFTKGKGPAFRNSAGIFKPGPLRLLGDPLNTITSYNDAGRFDDPETSEEPDPTSSPDAKLQSKDGKSVSPLSNEVAIFVPPKPAASLKRKPTSQSEVTLGIMAMSLNNKDELSLISDLSSYNNAERSALKKKRVDAGKTSEEALAGLKKLKVKDGEEAAL